MAMMQWGALVLLAAICATAVWFDVVRRRLPNWLSALTAVTGLTITAFQGDLGLFGGHVLHLVIAFIGGMLLFALGGFGGGDAKFYTGVAAWFALDEAILLLLSVTLSGLALLIVWFVYRRAKGIPVRRTMDSAFDGLPYGVAIATGAIIAGMI